MCRARLRLGEDPRDQREEGVVRTDACSHPLLLALIPPSLSPLFFLAADSRLQPLSLPHKRGGLSYHPVWVDSVKETTYRTGLDVEVK